MSSFEQEQIARIQREPDGTFTVEAMGSVFSVPDDFGNSDRRVIDEWISGGGKVEDAPPPPPPPKLYSFLEFMALLTTAEQEAVVGSNDIQVKLFTLRASGASFVDLANPETKAGVAYLVSKGILTAARGKAILAGEAA